MKSSTDSFRGGASESLRRRELIKPTSRAASLTALIKAFTRLLFTDRASLLSGRANGRAGSDGRDYRAGPTVALAVAE